VIYTSESSNRNSAILRGPGILGGLHICNQTLRKTEKQAILSLPYGRITNTYSLLTKFPIPLYLVNTGIQITLTGLPNLSLKPPHSFSFSAYKELYLAATKQWLGNLVMLKTPSFNLNPKMEI
jgi:hypothetical protein